MHKTLRLVLRFVIAGVIGEVTRAAVTDLRRRRALKAEAAAPALPAEPAARVSPP